MKRKILWGVMASFMIIAIALMTIMLIRMAQMTVPGASCRSEVCVPVGAILRWPVY